MVEFLIDNIYVEFGGHVYQQAVGIPIGTNCAPLVADLFLYSTKEFKKQKTSYYLTVRYIDDVLSLNNPQVQWLYWCYLSEGT